MICKMQFYNLSSKVINLCNRENVNRAHMTECKHIQFLRKTTNLFLQLLRLSAMGAKLLCLLQIDNLLIATYKIASPFCTKL